MIRRMTEPMCGSDWIAEHSSPEIEQARASNEKWLQMRSDIYIRDRGICWVCNRFVDLKDYDLGHLVDKCNGGHDDYDNLVVMHKSCNLSKPRHTTLEEVMKWKLMPRHLTSQPQFIQPTQSQPISSEPTQTLPPKEIINNWQPPKRYRDIKEEVITFFKSHPELLENSNSYNRNRVAATKHLAKTLNISVAQVRYFLLEEGLAEKYKPQITDGSQYYFVYEHLDELLNKYDNMGFCLLYEQPKHMGINHFGMDIMFYLSGRHHHVSKRNFKGIAKRVAQLGLPIRQPIS